jgi:hypothetical protein
MHDLFLMTLNKLTADKVRTEKKRYGRKYRKIYRKVTGITGKIPKP